MSMTDGQVNEVSQRLGYLSSQMEEVCDEQDNIKDKLDCVNSKVDNLDDKIPDVEESTIRELEEKARKHERWWHWTIHILGAVASVVAFFLALTYEQISEYIK